MQLNFFTKLHAYTVTLFSSVFLTGSDRIPYAGVESMTVCTCIVFCCVHTCIMTKGNGRPYLAYYNDVFTEI